MSHPFLPDLRRVRWSALVRIWRHFGDLMAAERRAFFLSLVGTLVRILVQQSVLKCAPTSRAALFCAFCVA